MCSPLTVWHPDQRSWFINSLHSLYLVLLSLILYQVCCSSESSRGSIWPKHFMLYCKLRLFLGTYISSFQHIFCGSKSTKNWICRRICITQVCTFFQIMKQKFTKNANFLEFRCEQRFIPFFGRSKQQKRMYVEMGVQNYQDHSRLFFHSFGIVSIVLLVSTWQFR